MELEKLVTENPLSRRDAIKLGGAALFTLTGCGSNTPSIGKHSMKATPHGICQKATNVTRGAYFVGENIPMRSDIRSDTQGGADIQPGLPLALKLMINSYSSNGTCAPLANARVDIWHCNAQGVYSGIDYSAMPQPSPTASPSPSVSQAETRQAEATPESTVGRDFLRGYQATDASGVVDFQTIYPGWHTGRAAHILVKVRVLNPSGAATTEATLQLFFNDQITNVVYLSNPAYQRSSMRDTLNATDAVYPNEKPPLFVNVIGNAATGYTATVNLGVQVGVVSGG